MGAAWIVGSFNDATQLTPRDDGLLVPGLVATVVIAALSLAIFWSQSRGPLYMRLIVTLILAPLTSLLGVFLLSGNVAALVQQRRDFPAAQTRTFDGLLLIQRAYRTDGKGRSWNIQTTPFWSNLDISEHDYAFMLAHRAPTDAGRNTREISSKGYFCARVTLQQAGQALRVLHAGNRKLPEGTVGICDDLLREHPTLAVVGRAAGAS